MVSFSNKPVAHLAIHELAPKLWEACSQRGQGMLTERARHAHREGKVCSHMKRFDARDAHARAVT
jgi:hypothetical protein